MTRMDINSQGIVVRLDGLFGFFIRRKPLVVAWNQVTGARADAALGASFPGLRWGATAQWPGSFSVGSFRTGSGLSFWNVRDSANTIVVDLVDHKYQRLVLEVADPAGTVATINRFLEHDFAATRSRE